MFQLKNQSSGYTHKKYKYTAHAVTQSSFFTGDLIHHSNFTQYFALHAHVYCIYLPKVCHGSRHESVVTGSYTYVNAELRAAASGFICIRRVQRALPLDRRW
jgi:hypothetical protein